MSQPQNQRVQRNLHFLQEMGLTPLWQRKQMPAATDLAELEQAADGPAQGASAPFSEAPAQAVAGLDGDTMAGKRQARELAAQTTAQITPPPHTPNIPVPQIKPATAAPPVPQLRSEARAAQPAAADAWNAAWDAVPDHAPAPQPVMLQEPKEPQDVPGMDAGPGEESPAQKRAREIAAMEWPALEKAVASCRACPLARGRTQAVFGVGDKNAEWLLVGEGPGRTEDALGEPFVGKSGKLLDNMLGALDLRRGENVYIANIVKCRPTDARGNDRPPTEQEAAACRPFLERQMALLQPRIILALGKTAAVSLLQVDPQTPVTQLRGQCRQLQSAQGQSLPVVVTYHPAYLLRQPAEKAKAWADLCLAQSSAQNSPPKLP